MKKVVVLGATGSVGKSALGVLARHREHFQVLGLAAGKNASLMSELALAHRPAFIAMADAQAAKTLRELVSPSLPGVRVLSGEEGILEVASLDDAEIVVAAMSGQAGLLPTMESLRKKRRVLLANKEALVMAGEICLSEARASGAEIIPVDSEHAAIFRLLPNPFSPLSLQGVRKIILTASGGPFRDLPPESLSRVSRADALRHPTWKMGPKISIDSATMMNKAQEVIEAHFLFGASALEISVLLHPQSLVHAMVEFFDASLHMHGAVADMRLPIASGLFYPERWQTGDFFLDWGKIPPLEFRPVDLHRFPALALGFRVVENGGRGGAVLCCANEAAVEAFLEERVPFSAIVPAVEKTLEALGNNKAGNLAEVMELAKEARERAEAFLA